MHKTRRTLLIGGLAVLTVGVGGGAALAGVGGGISTAPAGGTTTVTKTYGAMPYAKTVHRNVIVGPAVIEGVNAPAPGQASAAGMLPSDAPIPVSPALITVKNAWQVSTGTELVAVYAGSAGDTSSDGRFVIVRQHQPAGSQTVSTVNVPGSGAVSIVNPPTGSTAETTASLPYKAANGTAGVLDLSSGTASGS